MIGRRRPRLTSVRRAASGAVLVAGLSALAGCGGGSGPGPSPFADSSAPALWNPCDGLPVADVQKLFDTEFSVATGTATSPICSFTPTTSGDAVVNANYSLYDGSLGALIQSFGTTSTSSTKITTVTVAGSDGARLITQTRQKTFLITGYVKDGRLVQVVNVVDTAPYQRAVLLKATVGVLSLLSEHAVESGLTRPTRTATTGPTTGATGSPTDTPSTSPTGSPTGTPSVTATP